MYISDEFLEMGAQAVAEGRRMDLRKDGVFKAVFSRDCEESTYLRNRFISAVIGRNVITSIVINPELIPDFIDGKVVRLDVLCEIDDGEKVDIEMQMCNQNDNQAKRMIYYASKMCAGNLRAGEHYSDLVNVYQIMICNFVLISDDDYYHKFTFKDEACRELSDVVQIHSIELPKLEFDEKKCPSLSELEFFAILFKYNNDEEISEKIERLTSYKKEVYMTQTVTRTISKETYEWARQFLLEKSTRDYEDGIYCANQRGFKAGKEEGLAEGKKSVYSELIQKKLRQNKSYEQIAEELELSVEEVKAYEKN